MSIMNSKAQICRHQMAGRQQSSNRSKVRHLDAGTKPRPTNLNSGPSPDNAPRNRRGAQRNVQDHVPRRRLGRGSEHGRRLRPSRGRSTTGRIGNKSSASRRRRRGEPAIGHRFCPEQSCLSMQLRRTL